MATPSGRAHGDIEGVGDPNLIPIMSILCILIPMLIYSFVMYEVKVQEISLPKFGGSSGDGKGSKVLKLAVLVGRDQHVVKVQQEGGDVTKKQITVKKKKVRKCEGPCEECSGPEYIDYDYAGLYNEISKLKDSKEFRDVDTINIGADDNVPWKVLAKTIDAVRIKLEEPSFPDLCHYERAKPLMVKKMDADGKEVTVPAEMFPKVVFVMF